MAILKKLGEKKIPTILGLLVLVAGLGGGLYLVGRATIIPRASAGEIPKQIHVTNVTHDSLTVSWLTDVTTEGYLRYGTSENELATLRDDRDQNRGEVDSYTTHYVTVIGLTADTAYVFKIGSGTGRQLYDNEGSPYQQRTAAALGTPPAADTMYGKVMVSEAAGAEGAIVYVTLPGAAPLSALTTSEGEWLVSLSSARTTDLSAYANYDRQATTLSIAANGDNGQAATAVTTTANDSPVPDILLGNSHDFTSDVPDIQALEGEPGEVPPGAEFDDSLQAQEENNEEDDTQDEGGTDEDSGFNFDDLGDGLPDESTFELEILNPEVEGEQIATTQPEIIGTSPRNVTLTVTIESPTTYEEEVAVGEDGLWKWTPPEGLDPGEHTVTASYIDANGILQEVSRSFVVLAAGEEADLPSFEATPSATATPSASPSPTATASAPPRVSQPSTASGVPTAGVLTPTLVVFILGAGLFGAGIFWQLKSKSLARAKY